MDTQGSSLPQSVAATFSHLSANLGSRDHIIFCDVLHLFAFVLLAAVLLTATISHRVRRMAAWFLVISSATISTGSRILIVGQQTGPDPNRAVCIVQAMLLNGTAILNVYTSAAFLLHFYLGLLDFQNSVKISSIYVVLVQAIPVFIFLSTVIAVAVIGVVRPSLIRRTSSGMYCEVETSAALYTLTAVGLVGVMMTVSLKVVILIKIFWARKTQAAESLPPWAKASPETMARIYGYTVVLFVVFVLGVVSFFPNNEGALAKIIDITISVGAAVTAILFATESDIIHIWLFWRKPKVLEPVKETIPVQV